MVIVTSQTAEIGMTENIGEDGFKFEIWFRRRRSGASQDRFVLQSSSRAVKRSWVEEIRGLLWKQALRNRGETFIRLHVCFIHKIVLVVTSQSYFMTQITGSLRCRAWAWGASLTSIWPHPTKTGSPTDRSPRRLCSSPIVWPHQERARPSRCAAFITEHFKAKGRTPPYLPLRRHLASDPATMRRLFRH